MGGGASKREERLGKKHFKFNLVVGEGSFGMVYMATRKRFRHETQSEYSASCQVFAIKKSYKARVVQARRGMEILFNERELLGKVRSPFIGNLWACFQDTQSCFMVMDCLPGGDLRFHFGQHGHFDEATVKFFAAQAMLSLLAVHRKLIVHRDIKPDNIVLDQQGFARLTDFGISAKLASHDDEVMLRSGSRGYMAPEMLAVLPMHGIPVDFYALGVTMFEMLTGSLPLSTGVGPATIEWVQALQEERLKPSPSPEVSAPLPKRFVPPAPATSFGLSGNCLDVVAQLMEPRPWKRFAPQSLREVAQCPFFADVDWQGMLRKDAERVRPPIAPSPDRVNSKLRMKDVDEALTGASVQRDIVPPEVQARFTGFELNDVITEFDTDLTFKDEDEAWTLDSSNFMQGCSSVDWISPPSDKGKP